MFVCVCVVVAKGPKSEQNRTTLNLFISRKLAIIQLK